MNPLELQQGSPEWLTAREGQLTASLAPAMMGVGYQSRDKAMRSFLGLSQPEELTPFVKNMFEQGHIAEANARPVAEQLIGESLSPITGTREHCDIMFFASFDGLTFDNGYLLLLMMQAKFDTFIIKVCQKDGAILSKVGSNG